ncbi:class IIb bacteriocin, lactobin A/cerein 7B family [Flavobacterium piscisymbiosum]|uniref:Class IIb bacteriocin, lactobin A/cerein 7B family n=1 Tax=Flavobacterium piscisymbiosum TaxID=2893753 RepID=A0ABS8MAS2_9FLAO|nr:class IIb bacteriocin, lactobin A/cerein 7B family [Flavobacterium sp. F-30]MCC9062624.1 class IIb bacteriocin, lactobin A/cerein 7B family [Flavobacterium sp. F-30]
MELELINLEDLNLVELNVQETQEIEGGIIPLIIAVSLLWGTHNAY